MGETQITDKHVALRNEYVHKYLENSALPLKERRQVVFLDESYLHNNYTRDEVSLYSPGDKRCYQPKHPHKGRRLFCCAVYKIDSTADGGIVPRSARIFCPTSKNCNSGDYNKNFNSENLEYRFSNKLLPNLTHSSLIVMDDAKHHKAHQKGT